MSEPVVIRRRVVTELGGQRVPPQGGALVAPGNIPLRDWFAGQALVSAAEDNGPSTAATLAYQYADAMLAERAKAVRK